jgi:hypothetical protein
MMKSLHGGLHMAFLGTLLKATYGLLRTLSRGYLGVTKGPT